MSKLNRRTLLASAMLDSRRSNQRKSGEPPIDAASRERIRRRYFPDVQLLNHEGKRVRLYTDLIKDKIVTINFMYADCEGICPTVTSNLAQVQRSLKSRV